MKKKLNRFTQNSSNNTAIILVIFFLVLLLSGYVLFVEYKNKILNGAKNNYTLNINYLNSKIENEILNFDKNIIKKEISDVMKTGLFNSIEIEYNKFVFDKNSLIDSTNNFGDKSWKIAEVVVDARYGYIDSLPKSSLYEFVNNSNFNKLQPINIRYQVYKKNEIKNFITKLEYSNINIKSEKRDESSSWIDSLITIDTSNKTFEIKKEGFSLATVVYNLNDNQIRRDLQSFLLKLIFLNLIIFIPILFVVGFYHKYLFKKYVLNPVTYINEYLDNILKNKFSILDKNQFEGTKEIKELTTKISKVSSKLASLKNELNANKESLEQKLSSDTLTGLPNKSIFDFDIKSMFVSSVHGYIFVIKVDKLSEISKNHDSGYINNFIESYTNIIKNIIFKISKTDMKMYRFYGSQFAIIGKNINIEQVRTICDEIIEEISERMPIIYDVPDDLIHIGVTSFDLYGSLDSVLGSANDAYEISKEKGINSYYIIGDEDIEKNYELIDNNVIEVINRADFNIDFILDSYLFDNPEVLVMNEVVPKLFDENNKRLPIGSFVSVAQKLNIADKFDKIVIEKVIEYIKEKEVTHEIAINLSISSISDKTFLKWLENKLNENSELKKQIVFSITAYTAYLHKDEFVNFVADVNRIGAKIILKRYQTDEYPLNQLENLKIDYIRMHKDYTSNFTNDIVKKHKVKNILIFAELNNINIIADSVMLDLDYDLLERLGTFATSR